MSIVFHLGFYKTGSTYLQRSVMNGKFFTFQDAENPDDKKFSNTLRRIIRNESPDFWLNGGHELFSSFTGRDNVVISHESLIDMDVYEEIENPGVTKVYQEPESLISHLKSIRDNVIEDDVKVCFFFREQSEWLASWYAHICYRLASPSQHDFESKVKSLLSDDKLSSIVNFYEITLKFRDALGGENVLALPYELLNTDFAKGQLAAFTGYDEFLLNNDSDPKNKKKVSENVWNVAKKADFEGERKLVMPFELKALIQDKFRESNRNLSELLELDLESLCYY